jgi:putative N-acetyltransferase (TIGR04045 family)
MTILGDVLLGPAPARAAARWTIEAADSRGEAAYRQLRRDVFVTEQHLFSATDSDGTDDDPRRIVLIARDLDGTVLGGVRLAPATDPDLGWWNGSRLVVAAAARYAGGIGPALVRAACAHAEAAGALRFDATVQPANQVLFERLGWRCAGAAMVAGRPHVLMRWPIERIAALARATKNELGPLLTGLHLGGPGFVGDDGAPVPGSDLVAACDAIVPSMVERDPEWAGWCSVLVNLNDLAAMGATPVGLLDAVGARDASFASRVLAGIRAAASAFDVPVLGGHTQFGVPAALSVTALGRTADPVPGGGGQVGHEVRLTADICGGWRPGYTGRQWDSTSHRDPSDLRELALFVANNRPYAAKDVSMAGVVGTLGMLAEASGCGAELSVTDVVIPHDANMGDWLTCFPGFAMLTADASGKGAAVPAAAVSAVCGALTHQRGVRLRWPDGIVTDALTAPVTGLGAA